MKNKTSIINSDITKYLSTRKYKARLYCGNTVGLNNYLLDEPIWKQQMNKIDNDFITEMCVNDGMNEKQAESFLKKCENQNKEIEKYLNEYEKSKIRIKEWEDEQQEKREKKRILLSHHFYLQREIPIQSHKRRILKSK